MAELRKTGESRHEVLISGESVGRLSLGTEAGLHKPVARATMTSKAARKQ